MNQLKEHDIVTDGQFEGRVCDIDEFGVTVQFPGGRAVRPASCLHLVRGHEAPAVSFADQCKHWLAQQAA